MIDNRLATRLAPWQMGIVPKGDSERTTHELWRRLQLPQQPLWRSVAARVCLPMDWAFDRLLNLGRKLGRKIPMGKLDTHPWASFESNIAAANWKASVSFKSSEEIILDWCSMSPQQLQTCQSMLKWTKEDLDYRYSACIEQVKYLNLHIAPNEVSRPRPVWIPSPRAGACLQWAAKQVEQIDDGAPVPREFDLGPLTCEESGEVAIGLRIFDILFEVKQLERAIIPYVQLCNLAKTIAKIGLFAPPILMLLTPKTWLFQLSIPIAGALLVGRACQLYLRADDRFASDQERYSRITYFFALAKSAVYRNYHAEAARRERAEACERRREFREYLRRVRTEAEELRRETQRNYAAAQRNAAEAQKNIAETARNYRKIEELNESIRQLAENQVRLNGELQHLKTWLFKWLQTKAQGDVEVRVGEKVFSPQFIQGLLGLGFAHQFPSIADSPFAESSKDAEESQSKAKKANTAIGEMQEFLIPMGYRPSASPSEVTP